ncbi:MAG: peptide-methionine (S)-S-oxide reductase MsrA [Spirochaetia bacterium]|jgi:peptide-methionine (S)-S-oxide reductase
MKSFVARTMGIALAAASMLASCAPGIIHGAFPEPPADDLSITRGVQTAVLAGGCFWGMEGVFERLKGVKEAVSGYSGGEAATAQYGLVSSGTTGHAESIQVTYDPSVISYGTLLKVYFSIAHDPTELNYQGPDHGTQYRSAIFFANEGQKAGAEGYIEAMRKAKTFSRPIVTEVVPLKAFYPAEEYHQHFMDRNPASPYILMWDRPKVSALMRTYAELVTSPD